MLGNNNNKLIVKITLYLKITKLKLQFMTRPKSITCGGCSKINTTYYILHLII